MNYKHHSNCRVCNHPITPYLDLGMLPLSNSLASSPTDPINDQRYPLVVCLCEQCGLSQLSIVVDPEVLFGHYVYRSSISQGYKDHCLEWAAQTDLTPDSFHIDIAGNDGALLYEFRKFHQHKVLNVDPARNMVPINEAKGIRQYTTFWGTKAAKHLIDTGWPKADLITATNVIAHVDDLYDFLRAAEMMLSDNGVLIIECPYVVDMLEKKAFDTIYFEHLSYMSIHPLMVAATKVGLFIQEVSKHDIHGGSVRVKLGKDPSHKVPISEIIETEGRLLNSNSYRQFASDVQTSIASFREFVLKHPNIAGFAASAKGNTLLNCAGITGKDMDYIIDETPEKQGMYSPGTGIPIVSLDALTAAPPEYLVILAWNFADEIMRKCRAAGYEGKFVIPIPEVTVVEHGTDGIKSNLPHLNDSFKRLGE